MTGADQASEHLKQYLQRLTPQVRSRLLSELERLHLLGEDVPHSEELIATLRAEFRNTGQGHYRVGNPSRDFFRVLEPLLVDSAPERANNGQIARGSLGPIWSLITETLLPSMARDYISSAKAVIAKNDRREGQNLAAAFQKKVASYLDGVLGSANGEASLHTGLEKYTTSHATFNDLMKMRCIIRAQQLLREFADSLPSRIEELEADSFAKALTLLNALRAKDIDAVPFALTITAARLNKPWQLIRLATDTGSKVASRVLASHYAISVSMVLDQIDDKRLMLLDALKNNRTRLARDILSEIYAIEDAVRANVDLRGSDWGNRLQSLMTSIEAALDSEINTIPGNHLHLTHVLESAKRRPSHSWMQRMSQLVRKGHDAFVRS